MKIILFFSILIFSLNSHAEIYQCENEHVLETVEELGIEMVAEHTNSFEEDVNFNVLEVKESSASNSKLRVCQAKVATQILNRQTIETITRYTITPTTFLGEYYVELSYDIVTAIEEYELLQELKKLGL